MTLPIFALVGKPNSGKTTLMEKLIPELNRRGLKVGTIKHHAHQLEMDREGKDTWRHKQCGAHTVALASPTGLGVITDVDLDPDPCNLLPRYFHEVDLVIAEGYKDSSLPKIEVFRKAVAESPLDGRDRTWLAMVSDDHVDSNLPTFSPGNIPAIADFLVNTFPGLPCGVAR